MYIPFIQVTHKLFEELTKRGYTYFVIQRFDWPLLVLNKSFLVSAYSDLQEAQQHVLELDSKEGKLLHLDVDFDKISNLLEVNSGYRLFLNKFKDADWENRMLRIYKNNIVNYIRMNTRFKRKDPVEILFTLDKGRVWCVMTNGENKKRVLAYEVIK